MNATLTHIENESRETTIGRKVLAAISQINNDRRAAKAKRLAVIAAIRQSFRGAYVPSARQIRERWMELAPPGIPTPSLRSVQEHLRALRRT
jgi:hypothetical protein